MTIRLPTNKLRKAQTIVQTALQGDSLTLLDLQRITGYLNFVCTVVPLGRTFLRRLYNMELHFPPGNRHQRRRISTEARKDLVWWVEILSGNPEKSIAVRKRATISAWTDAASSQGLGAFYISETGTSVSTDSAFSIPLPTSGPVAREHINTLEMRAVEQAILYWGHTWKGKRVVMYIDNQAVVHGLTNGTMRGAPMEVLRRCLLLATEYDLELETHWIATKDNALADALWRLNTQKIAIIAPQLIHPKCNLRKRGLLMFSNRDSHQRRPTTSGEDSHLLPDATTTPPGHASPSSAPLQTTNTRTGDVSLPEPHG